MIIKFDELEEKKLHQFKGGEKDTHFLMYVDNMNKIMQGKLEPGASIGLHSHDTNSEVIFILSGTGKALYDDGSEDVAPGKCHYCPKGHSHGLINNGIEDLIFYAVVPEQ